MNPYKVDFSALPWESPAAGVRYKAAEQAGRKLRLVEFGAEFVEPDWCTKGHIGYLLEGTLEIDYRGRKAVYQAGDGIFIPTGQEHGHKARAISATALLVLVEDV